MHIRTHQKEFEAFEWKFKSFEPNSKHSYANPNLSNEIRNIWMQNLTIQTKFKAFECKF